MSIKGDVLDMEKEIKQVKKTIQDTTFAMELLQDMKKQNRRMFTLLLVIIGLWFATIGSFIYYLSLYDFTTEATELNTNNV